MIHSCFSRNLLCTNVQQWQNFIQQKLLGRIEQLIISHTPYRISKKRTIYTQIKNENVAKTLQQRRNNLSPARLYMQLKYIYGSGCMQKRCQSQFQRRKSRSTPTAQCALLQFCIMTNPGDAFRWGESWTAAICELYEYSAVANADHEYVWWCTVSVS